LLNFNAIKTDSYKRLYLTAFRENNLISTRPSEEAKKATPEELLQILTEGSAAAGTSSDSKNLKQRVLAHSFHTAGVSPYKLHETETLLQFLKSKGLDFTE